MIIENHTGTPIVQEALLSMMENFLKDVNIWTVNGTWVNSTSGNETVNGNSSVNPLKRNEEVAKVEVTVLVLILVFALAGNFFVLLAIHTSKRSKSRMYYFMKHLSIADLVVAIFQVLPQLIWDITFRFYGPDFLCRLVKYLQVVGMFASTYMLVLMSIDRCLAICQPLRSLHQRKDCYYVIATWVLSLLFSIPQVHIFSLKDVGNGVFDCWGDFVQPWGAKAYITWISLTIYICPVTILSVCYGMISFKIWQNFRLKTRREQCISLTPRASKGSALTRVSSVKLISKAKIRTVKMTFVIVVLYIICWTPFFFVQMWSAWDPDAPREALPFIIAMLLASLNSCCNPWIYLFFAGHLFHDLMRRCLRVPPCHCERRPSRKNTYASSTYVSSTACALKSTGSQRSLTQTSTT
ncbi:oxytocin receptor b [Clupea harengus]|uniref:Oxytocin receptor b n=1 Tax=Clupea harengus TaxID=7950 RepID=A0A6P3VSJ8_CLUHA|nr:oxytocin receptor b [Clupea harengus]